MITLNLKRFSVSEIELKFSFLAKHSLIGFKYKKLEVSKEVSIRREVFSYLILNSYTCLPWLKNKGHLINHLCFLMLNK